MQSVSGIHTFYSDSPRIRRKRGVGIMEVMIAALVLGLLYAAVSNLQKGNRDALLRIRGRDGATEVAQNVIDNLGALGLASFTDENLKKDDATGVLYVTSFPMGEVVNDTTIRLTRTWEAQPGLRSHNMTVAYDVVVKVSPDNAYKTTTGSMLLGQDCSADDSNCAVHIYAKRLDVKVSWPFKNSTQSIMVSGVIR
jgi:hypothetical protein